MPASFIVLVLFTVVSLFCIGLVTLSRHLSVSVRARFAVAISFLVLWLVSLHLSNLSSGATLFFNRFVYVCPMVALVSFGLFLNAAFAAELRLVRRLSLFTISVAAAGSAMALSRYNVRSVIPRYDAGKVAGYSIVPGPLNAYVGVCLVLLSVVLVLRFFIIYHHAGPEQQKPLRVILQTLVATVAVALLTNVLTPMMFGGSDVANLMANLAILILVVSIAFSLLRYKFLDIRLVIARALGYIATIVTLAALYGFLVFGISQYVFDLNLSMSLQVFFSAMTGIAAVGFHYFKRRFDKLTNYLFYMDAYDPQTLFDEYNKVLVSTIDLDALLRRTSRVIAKHLKAEYCMIGVKDGSRQEYRIVGTSPRHFTAADVALVRRVTPQIHHAVIVADDIPAEHSGLQPLLRKYDIALLVRLSTDFHHTQEGLGYMVLGAKKSGNPYTSQDIKVVETLANELIIALQNALRFEEIERFNETLQQRVADATRKLKESNEKLRVLNEAKDDFIGMASHQLRTPLTSVKGYLSLVLEGDAGRITGAQRELLTQAFTSSQRMVYLVADLLNVSRMRTGKFAIERAPTDIADMIADEIGQLREVAAGRGVELTYRRPDDFPVLPLDETKTRQVVMNFLDNAIYYTPPGGHVRVELHDLPKSIELRVIDDGIGVPAADRHHLFTKFYRAKNAQQTRPDGTGLGLFMAKKVIVAQGGAIIFDSREGRGSTFGFTFPKDLPADGEPGPTGAVRVGRGPATVGADRENS